MRRVMGSEVSNLELNKRVELLKDLLDGKVSASNINARYEKELKGLDGDERAAKMKALQESFDALPERIKTARAWPPGPSAT